MPPHRRDFGLRPRLADSPSNCTSRGERCAGIAGRESFPLDCVTACGLQRRLPVAVAKSV